MEFSGQKSIYTGELVAEEVGRGELQVLALQPEEANLGMVTKRIKVKH